MLASEEGLAKLEKAAGRTLPRVKVAGIGRGTMRCAWPTARINLMTSS